MSLLFQSKEHKNKVINTLRDLIRMVAYPHLEVSQQMDCEEHFRWMEAQTDDLQVQCQFGTIEELQLTKLDLNMTFKKKPIDGKPS